MISIDIFPAHDAWFVDEEYWHSMYQLDAMIRRPGWAANIVPDVDLRTFGMALSGFLSDWRASAPEPPGSDSNST